MGRIVRGGNGGNRERTSVKISPVGVRHLVQGVNDLPSWYYAWLIIEHTTFATALHLITESGPSRSTLRTPFFQQGEGDVADHSGMGMRAWLATAANKSTQ